MKRTELRNIIREEIISEFSRLSNTMSGEAEKTLNVGLRDKFIHNTDAIRNSNYGGCGAMAKLLYYAIKKTFNIEPKIILLYTDLEYQGKEHLDSIVNNFKTAREFQENNYGLQHVVIGIPGTKYVVDTTGIHTLDSVCKKYSYWSDVAIPTNVLSLQTLNRWVSTGAGWNPTFSRLQIPDAAKVINDIMDDIKKLPNFKKVSTEPQQT